MAALDSVSIPSQVPSLLHNPTPIGTKVTLHLGVIDQPYRAPSTSRAKNGKVRRVVAMTTYDVAKILESKYGVYSVYYRVHERDIVEALEGSLQGALESIVMRAPISNPWARGAQMISDGFKNFILSREAERVGIPGTPTKAALRGVNHRLKRPYRSGNPRRPSFRDTGLWVGSTTAWID